LAQTPPAGPLSGGVLLVLLALANVATGVYALRAERAGHTVYVLTPMVDVVPGGTPLGAVEAAALSDGLRHQVDARDMQRAYGRLGSTLSLDDLLRGIEAFGAQGTPLSPRQRDEILALMNTGAADHQRIVAVQGAILEEEAALARLVAEVQGEPPGVPPAGIAPPPGALPPPGTAPLPPGGLPGGTVPKGPR
jgi:hypothetical protein